MLAGKDKAEIDYCGLFSDIRKSHILSEFFNPSRHLLSRIEMRASAWLLHNLPVKVAGVSFDKRSAMALQPAGDLKNVLKRRLDGGDQCHAHTASTISQRLAPHLPINQRACNMRQMVLMLVLAVVEAARKRRPLSASHAVFKHFTPFETLRYKLPHQGFTHRERSLLAYIRFKLPGDPHTSLVSVSCRVAQCTSCCRDDSTALSLDARQKSRFDESNCIHGKSISRQLVRIVTITYHIF